MLFIRAFVIFGLFIHTFLLITFYENKCHSFDNYVNPIQRLWRLWRTEMGTICSQLFIAILTLVTWLRGSCRASIINIIWSRNDSIGPVFRDYLVKFLLSWTLNTHPFRISTIISTNSRIYEQWIYFSRIYISKKNSLQERHWGLWHKSKQTFIRSMFIRNTISQ